MREDCCHFQTRSYSDGEVARFCTLDLAPEAPWRCPENCPRYERLLIDSGFEAGSLALPPVEEEPDAPSEDIVGVLDEAEDIVNAAAPEVIEDLDRNQKRGSWWQRLSRRHKGGDDSMGISDR
ncbi:MAG: hypothetical protein QOJ19_4395 [Acidimicrobiia bacterium]|jgi:hypothetical protein|nr:hypothetical protein [Acidimicrobiia bacterium]